MSSITRRFSLVALPAPPLRPTVNPIYFLTLQQSQVVFDLVNQSGCQIECLQMKYQAPSWTGIMFGDGSLTFREFAMGEPLPLATIHDAVLEFLRGRVDAAVFGAQAVNAYVDEPRMTQDVDILSPCAPELAEELRAYLNEKFQIAVRIRSVAQGAGYRLYQVRQPKNRHLVDVRSVNQLPPCNVIDGVLIPKPQELICQKLLSMVNRPKTPKGMIDAADLRRLLLTFPDLKVAEGLVTEALRATEAPEKAYQAWHDLADQEILPEDEDAGY